MDSEPPRMQVDVARVLAALARRAAMYQEQLQLLLRDGHQQLGRALGGPSVSWGNDYAMNDGLDWIVRAQDARARLYEVQSLIAEITRVCREAAAAGQTEA